jgi:hypothetical protein
LEHGWQGECFSEGEEEDGKGWIRDFIVPSFVCCFCVFFTNILFHFCSNLKNKLLPMRRCKRSKTSAKKKMPEMMMLMTTRFSWS